MQTDKLIVITTDEYKRGQTNTVPFLGTIDIDHEGKTYLDPSLLEKAQALEGRNINFFVYKEGTDYSPKKVEVKRKTVVQDIQKIPEEHLEKLVNHPDIIKYFTDLYASKFIELQDQVENFKDEKEQYIQFTQELQREIEKKDLEISFLKEKSEGDQIKPQVQEDEDLSKKKTEGDPIKPQTEESEILSVDQFLKDKVEAGYTAEQQKMVNVINSKSVEDLRKKFCSVYPLKEWKDLKGKQVKDYLIGKLKKA